MFGLLAVLALLLAPAHALRKASALPGSDVQSPTGYDLTSTGPKGSKLYKIAAQNSVYNDPVYLLDLIAKTEYDQGYDFGVLMGRASSENFDALMKYLLGDDWKEPILAQLLSKFLDWQFNDYMKPHVPQEYLEELRGISDGGKAIGMKRDVGALISWGIVLANFPSDLVNIKYILQNEAKGTQFAQQLQQMGVTLDQFLALLTKLSSHWAGLTCSMFGVWGSRTHDGRLFTGRNLDWVKDSGISKYKLVTVHHPSGGFAHATLGWAGIVGALTGMSNQGITAHEANLESNDITFDGFPWVTRLRHVMAHAKNLEDAASIWSQGRNTVGFTHGFGSSVDRQFMVMETMMSNTATFRANDPREQDLVVDGVQLGQARPEVLFRTNHGYDSYTISHYMWNDTTWYNSSQVRYLAFPELFDGYQSRATPITHTEAINVTAVLGSKGLDHIYDCNPSLKNGTNVLSVTYDPQELIAYAAWENGHGDADWVPAACNTYLALDLKPFLTSQKA